MRLLLPLLCAAVVAAHGIPHERFAAVPLAKNGLVPRYFEDKSIPLAKRQESCIQGSHPCLDVQSNQCCENTHYCYRNATGDLGCCPLGRNCGEDTSCSRENQYICPTTTTPTTLPTGTQAPTSTSEEECCVRRCPATTLYLCAADLGGNCCPFNEECRPDGLCISTVTPEPTSEPPLLTPIPEGCTTSQFSCTDGLGCCDNGQVCTQITGEGFCAPGVPTGTDVNIVDPDDDGDALSTGAMAGIAVGAVVGAGIIIGFATWLCISKRKKRRAQTASMQSGVGARQAQQNHYAGEADPAHTEMSGSSRPYRPAPARGMTQNSYFGPDAVAGPYTDPAPSEVTSVAAGASASMFNSRAMPHRPDAPGDIAPPVEIDSKDGPLTPRSMSQGSMNIPYPSMAEVPGSTESPQGRYELHSMGQVSPAVESPVSSPTMGRFEGPTPERR